MTMPESASTRSLSSLIATLREPEPSAVLMGLGITAALAVFSFHPTSWGVAFLAVGLVAGAVFPLSGIVGIALAITTLPLVQLGGALADIRADELLLLAVVVGVGARALVDRSLPRNEVIIPSLVFVGVAAGSMALRFAVTDFEVRLLAAAFPLAKHILRLLLFLSVVWVGSRIPKGIATMRLGLVAGGVAGAVFGVAQSLIPGVETFLVDYYPAIDGEQLRLYWGRRAFAAFDGNPNHMAVSMLLLAFLGLATADKQDDAKSRLRWGIVSVPMLFAIVASASRATYVVAVAVLLAMWLWQKRSVFGWALAAMVGYTLLVPNLLRTRMVQLLIVTDGSVSPESDVVKKLSAWATPFGQRETLRMTDNFYLDVLINFWPLALAAFLWLVWVVFARLLHEHRSGLPEPGVAEAALLAWASVIVLSLSGAFFSVPRASEILWLGLGLAWAWFTLKERQSTSSFGAGMQGVESPMAEQPKGVQ